MKVTRVYIEHAGVVVCLATSASAERTWDDTHRMLRGRGKRTRKSAVDLLFVVADSRDPRRLPLSTPWPIPNWVRNSSRWESRASTRGWFASSMLL